MSEVTRVAGELHRANIPVLEVAERVGLIRVHDRVVVGVTPTSYQVHVMRHGEVAGPYVDTCTRGYISPVGDSYPGRAQEWLNRTLRILLGIQCEFHGYKGHGSRYTLQTEVVEGNVFHVCSDCGCYNPGYMW